MKLLRVSDFVRWATTALLVGYIWAGAGMAMGLFAVFFTIHVECCAILERRRARREDFIIKALKKLTRLIENCSHRGSYVLKVKD